MDNLRQLTEATLIFANQNQDALPQNTGGGWAFQVPITVTTELIQYGAARNTMYCPAFPDMNNDYLWNIGGMYRILGYASTFPGGNVSLTNQNSSILPPPVRLGPIVLPPQPTSQRVLWADQTISHPNQTDEVNRTNNLYVGIKGGWSEYHRTSHLYGAMPAGGNVGMLDGHVEWRQFQDMHVRTTSGTPAFWW